MRGHENAQGPMFIYGSDAWASHDSVVPKDGQVPSPPDGRNAGIDFNGEKRSSQAHRSDTDPDPRPSKKGKFAEAKLRHMTHAVSENRIGLIVDGAA